MVALYAKGFSELVRKSNELGIKKDQIVGIYSIQEQVVMIYYI